MSYKATNWAYDLQIFGPQKFVLVALADFADEENTCYPGQSRLASMTGFSEATVRRALKRLEDSGLLKREHRVGVGGYRTSDRYTLQVGVKLSTETPTVHTAHWAESNDPPCTEDVPTVQSDRAEENHQKNHQLEPPVKTDDSSPVDKSVVGSILSGLGITNYPKILHAIAQQTNRVPSEAQALAIITDILSKAKAPVLKPDAFVLASIRDSWSEIQQYLDELAA